MVKKVGPRLHEQQQQPALEKLILKGMRKRIA